MINRVLLGKIGRAALRKADALAGRVYQLQATLDAMALRPFELHLEFTNLCNADCVFCPYQFQQSDIQFMSDDIFNRAVADYVACGGGSVGLTPIVGDALIHPRFLQRVRYLRSLPQIDRIWLTTNGILLDRFGIREILGSGLSSITISTAGFDEAMYERIYRSHSYHRMRRNVTALVEENSRLAEPLSITIALRPDRPIEEVLKDADFQPILAHNPAVDFAWAFASIGGKVTRESLPHHMQLRFVRSKSEACVQTYNGPIVLADGQVMACSCVAAMDASADLNIGDLQTASLVDIWRGEELRRFRDSFRNGSLNGTCATCDMYRNLDLYRSSEGRTRAALNARRAASEVVHRPDAPRGPFPGG